VARRQHLSVGQIYLTGRIKVGLWLPFSTEQERPRPVCPDGPRVARARGH
jgi:hypothetical protein